MTHELHGNVIRTRSVGVAGLCSVVMVLGVFLSPTASASTWWMYPDTNYWSPNVMLDATALAGANDYGYTHAVNGNSVAMNTAQQSASVMAGYAELSMMYEFRTNTFTCPGTGMYTVTFYWNSYYWTGGWALMASNLFTHAQGKIAIYIGADIWDESTSYWTSRGAHNLKVIDESKTVYGIGLPLPPTTKVWNDPAKSLSISYSIYLMGGDTYRFYCPVYITTYAFAYGVGTFAESWVDTVSTFYVAYASDGSGGGGGGGGGCVAEGTMVTMADGSEKAVEMVKVGDKVLGYDPETGAFMTQTVLETSSTKAKQILNINDGALRVTLVDQPLYVMTADGIATWVKDPKDLQVGWRLYCPETGEWAIIDSLVVEDEKTKVYDFLTDGVQTYLGNSFLLKDKPRK